MNNIYSKNKQNYSMNIANKIKIEEREGEEKSYSAPLAQRCTLRTDIENSFDLYITNKGGPKQREYERVAQEIIQLAMKAHRIRISRLVLDFVQDQTRVTYLVGVPAFDIDNAHKYLDIVKGIGNVEEKPKLMPWEILEEKSALVTCKLCRISFMKNEVNKIVTMKMISELKSHYTKNSKSFIKFDHFTKLKDTKRTWKVWELCYMIIIAEHDLMKTELKFAICQGIPVHEVNKIKTLKVQKDDIVRPEHIKGKLKQWRILFYLDLLKDVQIHKLTKMRVSESPMHIQIKFHKFITKFEISQPKKAIFGSIKSKFENLVNSLNRNMPMENVTNEEELEEKVQIKLNKLRIHYFFTETFDINELVDSTFIEVRITDGPDWSKVLAVARSRPFRHMNKNKHSEVQMEYSQVYFESNTEATQKMSEFYLTMKSGLMYDKDIHIKKNDNIDVVMAQSHPDNTAIQNMIDAFFRSVDGQVDDGKLKQKLNLYFSHWTTPVYQI